MRNKLDFLPPQAVCLSGPMGLALKKSGDNRLKKINYTHLVDPFRLRNEDDGAWRCEFWGKIVRSVIFSWYGTGDAGLLEIIRATVADIISTQTADGCISSYPVEKQTGGWDIWGRKYVLLGLLRYYNFVEPDPKVKDASIRLLDHLMGQVGPGRKNIIECGQHGGLAASSILGAVVGVYRLSGEQRHLDYARWIVDSGGSEKHDIFDAARRMVPPQKIGNGKAYEMISCFQGLSELYLELPRPEYRTSILNFYAMVRDREIFITGIGGLKDADGEYWFDGKFKQALVDPEIGNLGETCVTATWIHFCERVLRLTGDSGVADELEMSFYNGILGAMTPDGTNWIHRNPTPLAAPSHKIAAVDQIHRCFAKAFDGHDCCLAQGPEALAMAPLLAVLRDGHGITVNACEDMTVRFTTPSGKPAEMNISGGYPRLGRVKIEIVTASPEVFTVSLRIPAWWSDRGRVRLNGGEVAVQPGTYARFEREWSGCIELDMDLSVRPVFSHGGERVAMCAGPVVLAQDSRLGPVNAEIASLEFADADAPDGMYLVKRNADGMRLCDYASAGNRFDESNPLCVWLRPTV
jgi:hypothetical protein